MPRSELPKPEDDWHPADIVAALHKRGIKLEALAKRHGYHKSAPATALRKSWPAVERLIAKALDQAPQRIWPSRYRADGAPIRERASRKSTTGVTARNVQRGRAA